LTFFTFPENLVWLKHLKAEETTKFFQELLEVVHQSQSSEDWSRVADTIECWRETANIKADPEVAAAVEEGIATLERGEAVSWVDLKQELGL
jgi:hypothetical protein